LNSICCNFFSGKKEKPVEFALSLIHLQNYEAATDFLNENSEDHDVSSHISLILKSLIFSPEHLVKFCKHFYDLNNSLMNIFLFKGYIMVKKHPFAFNILKKQKRSKNPERLN
jgi:hypothetical protein